MPVEVRMGGAGAVVELVFVSDLLPRLETDHTVRLQMGLWNREQD